MCVRTCVCACVCVCVTVTVTVGTCVCISVGLRSPLGVNTHFLNNETQSQCFYSVSFGPIMNQISK